VRVERKPPSEDGPGVVRCKVCGHDWETTPGEDALLADLFEHDATHDEVVDAAASIRAVRQGLTALADDAQRSGEGDHADLGHDEP
jgi:hypothetical protein